MTTKYHTLQPFLEEILTSIRKDIKTDYLPGSPAFCKANFGSRPINRLEGDEINVALIKELLVGNDDLSEWVVNRWVFKHGDVYTHFAEKLSSIHSDFSSIDSLSLEQSQKILAGAKESFGARAVYFFSMLNGVVFPESIFNELRVAAEKESKEEGVKTQIASEQLELEKILERHERETSRLVDKYEQKLAGVLKKYMTDTEALKAQVRALQKR